MKNKIRNFLKKYDGFKILAEILLYLIEKILIIYYYIYKPIQILLIIFIIGFTVYFFFSYSGYYNSIKDSINPPYAQIISRSCDDKSSELRTFEYSFRIKYSIRNLGGNGYVDLEEKVSQNSNIWTKSTRVYLNSNQTKDIVQVFDEVTLFGGDVNCSIRVVGYSK